MKRVIVLTCVADLSLSGISIGVGRGGIIYIARRVDWKMETGLGRTQSGAFKAKTSDAVILSFPGGDIRVWRLEH